VGVFDEILNGRSATLGRKEMDFIEQWFGVSPDGGDGTLEVLYIGVGVLVVVLLTGRRWIMRRLARRLSPTADS
jgi:hypothetical protein